MSKAVWVSEKFGMVQMDNMGNVASAYERALLNPHDEDALWGLNQAFRVMLADVKQAAQIKADRDAEEVARDERRASLRQQVRDMQTAWWRSNPEEKAAMQFEFDQLRGDFAAADAAAR